MQWANLGDPEPMYSFLGVQLAVGVTPSVGDTNAMLDVCKVQQRNRLIDEWSAGVGFVTWGQDGDDLRIEGTNPTGAGQVAGDPVSPQVAVLVRKITAAGGRRNRGRMYWPGVSRTSVFSDGRLSSTELASFNTTVATLKSNLVALAQVADLVVLHSSAPFTPTVITDLDVHPFVATQRRRLKRS